MADILGNTRKIPCHSHDQGRRTRRFTQLMSFFLKLCYLWTWPVFRIILPSLTFFVEWNVWIIVISTWFQSFLSFIQDTFRILFLDYPFFTCVWKSAWLCERSPFPVDFSWLGNKTKMQNFCTYELVFHHTSIYCTILTSAFVKTPFYVMYTATTPNLF